MAGRLKGKQLVKHLSLTGSLHVSASNPGGNGAAISVEGGINQFGSSLDNGNGPQGIIDVGFFPTSSVEKTIVP